jgi:hypothetical protein
MRAKELDQVTGDELGLFGQDGMSGLRDLGVGCTVAELRRGSGR